MYERFTDRARKVMQLANQEAQRFNHEYIGTEHILLGLIQEGAGVAANVLKNLNADLKRIRREVDQIVQCGPDTVTMGKLPQTPRAKKVIEYAIEEARNLNHNYIGTEHLLLGLLREEEGVAAQVLLNLGLQLETVRREVLSLLGMALEENCGGRRAEATEGPRPPRAIRHLLRKLDASLESLRQAKEEAIANQDFEQAGRLRDEEYRVKKQREELLQTWRKKRPRLVLEGELHVPLQRGDGSLLSPEALESIRARLRERFGGLVETRVWVEGSWQLGSTVLKDEVVIFRVLSPEPGPVQVFLVQLKEQLKAELQHENILVVTRKAQVL